MTQASNKVEWCLKKAQKELQEKGLHRGLVRVSPNNDRAWKHLKKAEHNLEAAQFFQENGYSDWSASAFFYSLYHCFLALLWKHGYETRNQECTLAVIQMLCEEGVLRLDETFLKALDVAQMKTEQHSLIKIREDFQYGIEIIYKDDKEFDYFKNMCKEMINKTKEIVHT